MERIPIPKSIKLKTVYLEEEWLKSAVIFAHHNMMTTNPLNNKKFWNKAEASGYLRTCAIGKNLINSNYSAAKSGKGVILPIMWERTGSLKRCHYASMHMLFLGNVKNNFLMIKEWFEMHGILSGFAIDFNKILSNIGMLKLKHFQAHTLSNASHSTGSYVSENYLCMGRIFKVMMTLPIIEKIITSQELQTVTDFYIATVDCIGRLMSSKQVVENLELSIHVYLNSWVNMDKNLTSKVTKNHFIKSNSLGLLNAARAHQYFGPAILNWEGGIMGERIIPEAKSLMDIKREGYSD